MADLGSTLDYSDVRRLLAGLGVGVFGALPQAAAATGDPRFGNPRPNPPTENGIAVQSEAPPVISQLPWMPESVRSPLASAQTMPPPPPRPGKGRILLTMLKAGVEGAMAGRAASEQALAASGGRSSAGFGTGFQAAQQLPFLRAYQQQQLAGQQAQTDLARARTLHYLTPPKSPKPSETEQAVQDWLEAQGMPDSAGNRDKARVAILQRSRGAKPSEAEQGIADYLAAQGLENSPKNRDAARVALLERSKTAGQRDTDKQQDIADYLEAHKLPNTATNREKARNVIADRGKSTINVFTRDDAKEVADAIIRGEQPPTVTGLYRNAGAVRAELSRRHFNLARAENDWKAIQKHLATLNGPQQERLRQAITFTRDSLSIIEDLYSQWVKVGPNSGWKIFNKAGLAGAKQLPGEAGNIAHRLEAQINDLTSELGTVYKGGNTSTDESLELAAGNLKADWNENTFRQAVQQIRQNLDIRANSIRFSQPAGVSPNTPYMPPSEIPEGAQNRNRPPLSSFEH